MRFLYVLYHTIKYSGISFKRTWHKADISISGHLSISRTEHFAAMVSTSEGLYQCITNFKRDTCADMANFKEDMKFKNNRT